MKYPRVNLLKKTEQRYQGAVSHRFMLVTLVVAPILFIAVLSGVKLIQYAGVQSSLKASREIWERLEPRLNLYKEEQRSLSSSKQALGLFTGWQGTQVSLSTLLAEIQATVPTGIQLKRLGIRSEPKTSVYGKPADFVLDYTLMLQGVAEGERAEDAVIGLRKDLLESENMDSTFESVKLASMRKRAGKGGQSMREFTLEGSGRKGGGQ